LSHNYDNVNKHDIKSCEKASSPSEPVNVTNKNGSLAWERFVEK